LAKKVPTKLRLIRGAPKHKVNLREPLAEGDLSDPPVWMTPAQQEGWKYALENAPKGVLRRIDKGLLGVWVVAEDTHAIAVAKVAQLGMLARSPKGYPMQNPFLSIMNRQAFIMVRAASEMGFTPAARARLVSGEGDPINDWDTLREMSETG